MWIELFDWIESRHTQAQSWDLSWGFAAIITETRQGWSKVHLFRKTSWSAICVSACFVSIQSPQTLGVCAVGPGLYHRNQHWMRFLCLNKSLVSEGLKFYSHNGNCYRNAFHTEKRVSWIPSRRVLVLPYSVQIFTGTWVRKIGYVSFVLTQCETAIMSCVRSFVDP